ncbi:MAG: hypothetical protein IJ719_10705 [Clostridia bacterium]|nr:hypothetical protein [Clostridia bacterium]
MKKALALMMAAMMALIPVLAGASGSYAAGDLTATAILDGLEAGNQIWFHLGIKDGEIAEQSPETMDALNTLLAMFSLDGKAYMTFGETVISGTAKLDETELLQFILSVSEDGTARLSTSLTDDSVFLLGSINAMGGFDLNKIIYSVGENDYSGEFKSLPAWDRLRISSVDMLTLFIFSVLSWTSGNQIDMDNQFYVFDNDTFFEATDTRDEVASRMIGTITADQFCALFWDYASLVDSDAGYFQRALADYLAEQGVTRLQFRAVVDALFPNIQIDPETDYVEPTHIIPDDGALCQYNDVSYLFKKLVRFTDLMWEESTDETLSLIVSFNDYNETVGFDAVLPKFTTVLPYEGSFTYSKHTDEDWQVLNSAHGELQISDKERVIGDYAHLNGEDVDGYNGNTFDADLSVVNQESGKRNGFAINGEWSYEVDNTAQYYTESLAGSGKLTLHLDGNDIIPVSAKMTGLTDTAGNAFALNADASVSLMETATFNLNIEMGQEMVTEITLPQGEEYDVTAMDQESIDALQAKITNNATAVLAKLITNQKVMQALNALQ